MNQSRSLRAFSLSMALLLLFASSGISMDLHFCDGHLKRANLFGKAKTCQEVAACMKKCGKALPSCMSKSDHNNCCDNESVTFDFDYEAGAATAADLSDENKQFVLAFAITQQGWSDFQPVQYAYISYIPPPLIKDLRVVYQSFLC